MEHLMYIKDRFHQLGLADFNYFIGLAGYQQEPHSRK